MAELRKPFPASKISFKCQTKPNDKGNALVVAYIDARDVMERLNEVVGPDWSDRYEKAGTAKGLVCYLTVCGVTRADVGDDDNENEPVKSAYNDAFKRAAVKFGIGRFLYDLPKMWGKAKPVGKSFILEDGELERLRKLVDDALVGRKPGALGNPSRGTPPAAKATAPAKASAAEKTLKEPADLRRQHGELWMQAGQANLLKDKTNLAAWGISPKDTDDELRAKIAALQAGLNQLAPGAKP